MIGAFSFSPAGRDSVELSHQLTKLKSLDGVSLSHIPKERELKSLDRVSPSQIRKQGELKTLDRVSPFRIRLSVGNEAAPFC